MNEKTIKVEKTARYYTNHDNKLIYNNLTYCLHGYGQLANYFSQKFTSLDLKTLIVVPEGLNKFYLEGYNGRVGSTWMTKEDRENDIVDYINYLSTLHTKLIKTITTPPTEINVIGFSQGVSTLLRWINNTDIIINKVFLFSGAIPEELHTNFNNKKFNTTKFYYSYDELDNLIDVKKFNKTLEFFTLNNLNHQIIKHNHGHHIDTSLLKQHI